MRGDGDIMIQQEQRMVGATEACEMLGVTIPTLYRYKKMGIIRATSPSPVVFSVEDIESVVAEKERRKSFKY